MKTRVLIRDASGSAAEAVTLAEETAATIGRAPDNTIVLKEASVSSHHARLECADGEWWLTDLNSRNGTFVNGRKVTQHRLVEGDKIVISKTRLVLETVPESVEEAPDSARVEEAVASAESDSEDTNPVHQPVVRNAANKTRWIVIGVVSVAALIVAGVFLRPRQEKSVAGKPAVAQTTAHQSPKPEPHPQTLRQEPPRETAGAQPSESRRPTASRQRGKPASVQEAASAQPPSRFETLVRQEANRIGMGGGVLSLVSLMGPRDAAETPVVVRLLSKRKHVEEAKACLPRIDPDGEQAVPMLVELLRDKDTRQPALDALKGFGNAARDAIPAVVELIGDKSAQFHARDMLGFLQPAAPAAAPPLANLLKHRSAEARLAAAATLGEIGPPAAVAAAALLEAVGDVDERVRSAAAKALEKIGAPAALATGGLQHPHPEVRLWSAAQLGRMGPAAKDAVGQLASALKDPDTPLRAAAAEALASMGPAAMPAVGALTEALADPELRVATHAAIALGVIGRPAAQAAPALQRALAAQRPPYQSLWIWPAGQLGPASKTALPQMLDFYAGKGKPLGPEESERGVAAEAIGELGTEATPAVRFLTTPGGMGSVITFDAKGWALGQIGRPALDALVALLPGEAFIRQMYALKNMNMMHEAAAPAIPAIVRMLHLADPKRDPPQQILWVARDAALALGAIGPQAASTVGDIRPWLAAASRFYGIDAAATRAVAAEALGLLGPAAAGTVSDLLKILSSDPKENVRITAATALGRISPSAEVIQALLATLHDNYGYLRDAAAEALAEIGPPAVPRLIETVQKEKGDPQLLALRALARIGPPAASAVPVLISLLTGLDQRVSRAAASVLAAIGPQAVAAAPALKQVIDKQPFRPLDETDAHAFDLVRRSPANARWLLSQLLSKRKDSRDAIAGLQQLGVAAAEIVPDLRGLLMESDRPDASVTNAVMAVQALEAMHPDVAKPALPALVKAASSNRYFPVRRAAEKALRSLQQREMAGTPLPPVPASGPARAEALVWQLRSLDPALARQASEQLVQLGPDAVPILTQALRDKAKNVRGPVAEILGRLGAPAADAVPELLIALADINDVPSLHQLLGALDRLGPAAVERMKSFRWADCSDWHRERLIRRLGRLGPKMVPILIERLDDKDFSVRQAVKSSLAEMPKDSLPALCKALDDSRPLVRMTAVGGIVGLGPDAATTLPQLREMSRRERDREVQIALDMALQHLDAAKPAGTVSAAPPASPDQAKTAQLINDLGSIRTLSRAQRELGKLGTKAVPALIAALDHLKPDVRVQALGLLRLTKPPPTEALPAICRVLRNDNRSSVREAAAATVAALTREVPPELIAALKDEDQQVRCKVAEAFVKMGPGIRPAIPHLVAALDDAYYNVAEESANALASLGAEGVTILIQALNGKSRQAQCSAAEALGRCGGAAREALPVLERLSKQSKDDAVRRAAGRAMGEIRGKN